VCNAHHRSSEVEEEYANVDCSGCRLPEAAASLGVRCERGLVEAHVARARFSRVLQAHSKVQLRNRAPDSHPPTPWTIPLRLGTRESQTEELFEDPQNVNNTEGGFSRTASASALARTTYELVRRCAHDYWFNLCSQHTHDVCTHP
jgi:hypothetical protein